MIRDGQVVLFTFPQTNLEIGKLRPALILRRLPGAGNDWLVCMISTQLSQQIAGLDEAILDTDSDFGATGLKQPSVIRATRLAVVTGDILHGSIGQVTRARLSNIRARLGQWILGESLP